MADETPRDNGLTKALRQMREAIGGGGAALAMATGLVVYIWTSHLSDSAAKHAEQAVKIEQVQSNAKVAVEALRAEAQKAIKELDANQRASQASAARDSLEKAKEDVRQSTILDRIERRLDDDDQRGAASGEAEEEEGAMTIPDSVGGIALLLLAGCSLPQRHVELVSVDPTMQVVSVPAELRNAYVLTGPGTRFCAEPTPDIALASTTQLSGTISALSATGQKVDATAAADLATSVVELSGRNALVLLARDLLFRACTIGLGGDGQDEATAIALFKRVADLIEKLARAEVNRSEADLARATAARERAGAIFDTEPTP